jgi:lipopolysaccharide/colanic/teichoic acid biosynthesis glycosyltransferase
MSLVGPRPPLPYEVDHYTPHDLRRLAATPGITGLWQVSGRNKTTFAEMVALDLEYIATRSLWKDIAILLRTVPVVFEGAH